MGIIRWNSLYCWLHSNETGEIKVQYKYIASYADNEPTQFTFSRIWNRKEKVYKKLWSAERLPFPGVYISLIIYTFNA